MSNLLLADGTPIHSLSIGMTISAAIAAATTPATYDAEDNELTPKIVPDEAAVVVKIQPDHTRDGLGEIIPGPLPCIKTHPWRLPKARAERLETIRAIRNAKLFERDAEAGQALTGRPGARAVAAIEINRQTLRDLPPVAEAHLATLTNTDDIDAYLPDELV